MVNKTTLSLIPLVIAGIFWVYYCFMIPHPHTELNGMEYAFAAITFAAFFVGTTIDEMVVAINKHFKSNKSTR